MEFPSQARLAFPVLPSPASVTLGKSLPLAEPQFQDRPLPSRSSGSREGRGPETGSVPVRPPQEGRKGYKDNSMGAVRGAFEQVTVF